MPVYHSGQLSRTGRPDYNYPLRPTTKNLTRPLAPRNLIVTSPYIEGKIDLRWDNPALLPENSGYRIIGVNVYRCTDTPYGTYIKLNSLPVGTLSYRDESVEEYVEAEDATLTIRINEPDNRWLVYTRHKPVVIPGTNGKVSFRAEDVKVEIDDGDGRFVETAAFDLNGLTGEVTLVSNPVFNHTLEQIVPPRLPRAPNGRIRLSYYWLKHHVLTALNQRIYYKATTVAEDPAKPGHQIETPLEEVSPKSTFDIEEIDWIWREAILRNRWLLEQQGERVKVFIRKWMGERCSSYESTYGQSHNDCAECFGTNFKGGFEGPYEIIIAPPETEKAIELLDMGLHIRYDIATWTSDFPLLNERDVIVRQNNERYVVGPVNYQGSRGAVYQQHFTISYIDAGDIRYRLPISGGETSVPLAWDQYRREQPSTASPVVNAKPEIPEQRIIRGRTVTFENITY